MTSIRTGCGWSSGTMFPAGMASCINSSSVLVGISIFEAIKIGTRVYFRSRGCCGTRGFFGGRCCSGPHILGRGGVSCTKDIISIPVLSATGACMMKEHCVQHHSTSASFWTADLYCCRDTPVSHVRCCQLQQPSHLRAYQWRGLTGSSHSMDIETWWISDLESESVVSDSHY